MIIKPFNNTDDGGSFSMEGGAAPSAASAAVPATQAGNDFLSSVPEQYRETEYVRNLAQTENPTAELWTKFVGMQEALQVQPGGMPNATDPPEAWQKWAETVAPADIQAYGQITPQIDESQAHLKDLLEPVYAPEIVTTVLDAARTLGVQPYQMQGLMGVFNQLQTTAAENFYREHQKAELEYNQQFDTFCEKQFGKDREKIIGEGFNFIAANVSADLATHVNNLPNEALATVAALAYNLKQRYGKEDSIPAANQMHNGGLNDVVALKAAISDKMNLPAYQNSFDGAHAQAVEEVRSLSAQLARLTQPSKQY